MQQSAVEKYKKLIEYLKLDFLHGTIISCDTVDDYDQLKEWVEGIFDIETSQSQIKKYTWIKRYTISEGSKQWDFLVVMASVLFAHNMQTYREQLLEKENIQGIITLKNYFFDVSVLPAAVIVLGEKSIQGIWLTSAASSEDIITIFSKKALYQKNVFYTDKLDPISFMPEHYNGERERIDVALDKYETKTLKEIADIILGKNVSRLELGEEGIPYLRQRDIQNGAIIKPSTYVMESAAEKYAKQLLQEGDILLTKNFGQHKVARVTSDNLPAIASNSLFIIRAFGVPEGYLYEYFTSNTGKAILDQQLSSIERGAAVVTINMADLKELRVPIFDEATMLSFSQIENMKAEEVLLTLRQMRRLGAYVEMFSTLQVESEIRSKIYSELLNAGWAEYDLKLNSERYMIDLKAGKWAPDIILLDGDNWLGGIEIKRDFSNLAPDWISKMREILEEAKIPCLILTTGSYFEVHFTHQPIVKKLQKVPTKELLLSILVQKECD